MYELKLEKFSGPLEKLLELIEDQKLDVNEVSMAKVTDDFLKYLDTFKNGEVSLGGFSSDLRLLADFISVASKLIFLKSKYLLPNIELTEDEEIEIKDLESRLVIYRDLKPAFKLLSKFWKDGHRAYSRPYFLGRGGGLPRGQSVFYPGAKTDKQLLENSLYRIFEEMKVYSREEETIKGTIITLEEKIQEVFSRIQKEGDSSLNNLAIEKTRAEMIILFLAVLHLAREQFIRLEQIDNFSDIIIKKN
jgi:segregation and condensation protein A